MKSIKTLSLLLFSAVLFFYSCNNKSKALPTKSTTSTPSTFEPPQNASGVWHYSCRNGCTGGAGAAVKCSTCGNTLAHNPAYHANTVSTPTNAPFANPPATTPSKNTAGIWHYSCGNGCTGGSGTAGACATCGSTLNHNAAYHE